MAKHYLFNNQKEFIDFHLTIPQEGGAPDILVVYVDGFASSQKGEKVLYFRDRFNERGYAFLTFDHRGHGSSSGSMRDLTVTRNLEDLDRILASQAKAFKKHILIGSSMGGQTAAWFGAHHPGRIAANLLIAPGFRFLENRKKDLGPEGLEELEIRGEVVVRNECLEVTIGKEMLMDAEQYPVEKLLPDYKTPTLILHGIKDETVPFEDSVSFTQGSSARPLELLLIAGGDHRLTDYKKTLFESMNVFLNRLVL